MMTRRLLLGGVGARVSVTCLSDRLNSILARISFFHYAMAFIFRFCGRGAARDFADRGGAAGLQSHDYCA